MNRVVHHPILGDAQEKKAIQIFVDGQPYAAYEGDMIAAALLSLGISTFRYTNKNHKPRSIYCGIGRCTDCIMMVDGVPNVRTCITPVHEGIQIQTQDGAGNWNEVGTESQDGGEQR